MSVESQANNSAAAGLARVAWLWKLLFVLLLGPVLLFADRFPLWVVLAALGLLLLPWIVTAVQTRRLLPAAPINFLLLPLLLLFLPLSLWLSPLFLEASLPKALILLWSVAVFYAVVDAVPAELTAGQRESRLRLLVLIYMAAGVAMTAVGLLAMDSVASRLPVQTLGIGQIVGSSVNPNEVAGVITLYLPLVVALWAGTWAYPERRSVWRFALWLAVALFFAAALLLTGSFGALTGVIAGCALVLLLLNRRARLLLLPIGLVTILGVFIVRASPLYDPLALAARVRWSESIISRLAIWQQALHSTQDFPLGTGLGSFRFIAPVLYPLGTLRDDVWHAHNLFWQAALDFGWLGGLIFALLWLILILYLVQSLRKMGRTQPESAVRVIAAGLLGALVAHAFYSLFDALAPGARPTFALWYLFGLSVAVGTAVMPAMQKTSPWRAAAALVTLLLLAAMLWRFWPLQQASSVTALALLKKPQINEATAALAAQKVDENCRLNWHIGRLAHERDDWEARDAAWQKLLACSPQHIYMMQTIVLAESELAEPELAVPEVTDPERTDPDLAAAAIAGQPDDAAGYFWRASQVVEDDIEAAIALYEQGLALTPNDGLRWVELGKLRETNEDNEGAIEAFNKGCVLVDRGKNGCPRAARLYMAAGEYELAAARYRTSLQQLPGWLPGQRGLADALIALGRAQEAVPYLTNLAENGDNMAQEQLQEIMSGEQ